jgi:hypothetical protein
MADFAADFAESWIDLEGLEYGLELFDSCRTMWSAEPMNINPLTTTFVLVAGWKVGCGDRTRCARR